MTTRAAVLDAAAKLIGNYGKGSREVYAIWRQVLPADWSNAQVELYAKTREWCGGSALCVLQNAGLTEQGWEDSLGFLHKLKLPKVPLPKPGDLAVQNHKPFHYMIVEYWNHSNDWGDLAGNTPFYARHRHASSRGIDFYSIAKLVGETDTTPAPPRWDDETEPGPPKHPTLRLGAKHEAVRVLQAKLNSHGASLRTDGSFGAFTKLAVESFQRRAGLTVDGVVGPRTWAALEAV